MDISTPEKLLAVAIHFSYGSAAIVYVVFRCLEISMQKFRKRIIHAHNDS